MTQTDAIRLVRHAAIIKAFAEGKQIQVSVLPGGRWVNLDDPSFDREDEGAYRVKPEPRASWRIEFYRGDKNETVLSSVAHDTKKEAEEYGNGFSKFIRVVKFVEVPE